MRTSFRIWQREIAKHSRIFQSFYHDTERPDSEREVSLEFVNKAWNSQYGQADTNTTKTINIDLFKNESRTFDTQESCVLELVTHYDSSGDGSQDGDEDDESSLPDSDEDEEALSGFDGEGDDADRAGEDGANRAGVDGDEDVKTGVSAAAVQAGESDPAIRTFDTQDSGVLELVTHYDSSGDDSPDGDEDDESSLPDSDEDEEALTDLDGEGDDTGRAGRDGADRAGVDGDGDGEAGVSAAAGQAGESDPAGQAGVPARDTADQVGVPEPDATGQTGVTEPPEAANAEDDGDQAPEPGLTLSAQDTSLAPVPTGSPTEQHNGKETNYVDFDVGSDSSNDEEDPEQEQQQQVTKEAIQSRPVALRRSKRLRQQEPDELLESQTITVAVVTQTISLRRSTRIRCRPDYYTPRWD